MNWRCGSKQLLCKYEPKKKKKKASKVGVVIQVCNPGTWEAEAGGLQVELQTGFIASSRAAWATK
jgi:hypothetical protein